MKPEELKAIDEQTQKGIRNGNGYMAWVENDVLRDLLAEVKRLNTRLDAYDRMIESGELIWRADVTAKYRAMKERRDV